MTRFFYGRADAIVATSRGVADDLAANYGVPRSKIHVLHNPVDLDAHRAAAVEPIATEVSGDRPVVAAAGRLAGVKNYPLLIAAIAELAGDDAGRTSGSSAKDPSARASKPWRTSAVSDRWCGFLGFQQNPWRYIARADVFALTSTYEGFGNVLIEAMACGTPVVATKSPGTVEIIADGDTGALVDHDARSIADAIGALLTDRAKRDAQVARARDSVGHYALPAVAERYDRLFQELTA